jgi:hypothetical protein
MHHRTTMHRRQFLTTLAATTLAAATATGLPLLAATPATGAAAPPIQNQESKIQNSSSSSQTMTRLWQTSPFQPDAERTALLKTLQAYSEKLPHAPFKEYLAAGEQTAAIMEQNNPILGCYRLAIDRVMDEVAQTRVERGTAAIWLLYNMGIVVKTPSGCFGVDINHRLAEKLAPHLDFLCVTHNHADHKSVELMEAMRARGKPVLSNFYRQDASHCSKEPAHYQIGAFAIRTAIADHNEKLPRFITMYRIDCGEDTGGFTLLHCGDSNFTPPQFKPVQGPVALLILRYGDPDENRILDALPDDGQIRPQCAALSHVIELRHDIEKSPRRRTLDYALSNTTKIHSPQTILPFWGEKLLWKNGHLQ